MKPPWFMNRWPSSEEVFGLLILIAATVGVAGAFVACVDGAIYILGVK